MLINGDDALFKLPLDQYGAWKQMVSDCGLSPSLGKNYISNDFIMLNSELWWIDWSEFSGLRTGRFLPFVNLGLLSGRSKVLSDSRKENPGAADIVSNCCSLLRGWEGEYHDQLLSYFISANRAAIESVCYPKQNWFLPRQLGGLGLPRPKSREVKLTRGQRKLASNLFAHPCADFHIPSLNQKEDATHLILSRKAQQSYLKHFELTWGFEKDDSIPDFTRYFEGVPFETTVREVDRVDAFRQWERLWNRLTDTKLNFSDEKLWSFKGRFIKVIRPETVVETESSSRQRYEELTGCILGGSSQQVPFDLEAYT
jgi:hypothetical protein